MESTDVVSVVCSDAAAARGPCESFEDESHAAQLPEFQPLRGITLRHIDHFVNVEVPQMLGMAPVNGRFRIVSQVDRVTLDEALVATITTTVEHRLYKFDQVAIDGVDGRGADTLLNGRSFTVANVRSPTEFQIQLRDVRTDFTSGDGGVVVTPVNMYKACPEVVIPSTTTAESLVRISSKETLDTLRRAVVDPSSNLALSTSLVLPDAHGHERLVRKGLTVHGRLSPLGCVRRRYWSLGDERHQLWRTPERWHLPARERCGALVDTLPAGEGGFGEREDKLWSLEGVEVGDILVLRTGVAYAELFDDGDVDDFVSHWWGEESHDLVVSLWSHEDDWIARQPPGGQTVRGQRRKYVCTLVNRQHCVVLGTWDDWEGFIFNVVLRHVGACGGNVVLGLDGMAMPLKRIWCIFEAWVSASHGIRYYLYTVHGELHKCMQSADPEVSKLARSLQDKVGELDLRDAQSTQEEDRQNIMHLIEDSQGGVDRVEYMVKNTILNTQAIMNNMQRIKDPMTGKLLTVEGDKPEILPARARPKEFGLHGPIRDGCRRRRPLAARDLYRKIRDRGERVLVAAPGGAGKTSLTVELARLVAKAESHQATAAPKTCMRVPLSQLGGLVTAWMATVEGDGKARRVVPEINDPLVDWAEARFGPKYTELLEPPAHAGLFLILDALDESSDPNAVLFWLKHWTSQRQKAGWKDDLVITTRVEALVLHVRVRLRAMLFETYELALLTKEEAMEIVSRIAGPWSARKVERLTPALYERPLMATLVAHYFAGLPPQESGSGGSLLRTPESATLSASTTTNDTTESVVLEFMRRRFIEQAARASSLQQKDISLALGHLAFTATAQRPDAGSHLHTRARTRLLDCGGFEQACKLAELDADSAGRLFKLARRGELRVLEPVNDGRSVQFMHLLVQDYFAACFLYEGPGDAQPFKDCWRSVSELSAARGDGLGPLREHLIGLIASESPRGEGAPLPRQPEYFSYTSLCWMQVCAIQGGPRAPEAVARTVRFAGKDPWSVGFAMDRAQNARQQRKTIAALAREADIFDMGLFLAAATSNSMGPLFHPGWLLLAFYSIAWRSSGSYVTYQLCSAVSGLAGLLSLGLNVETMGNPFTIISSILWGLPYWALLSARNFVCLPAVLFLFLFLLVLPLLLAVTFGLLRSLGLMRVVCGNFFPIQGAPLDSKTVRFLGRRAPRAAQLFLILGNVAAIVGLAW